MDITLFMTVIEEDAQKKSEDKTTSVKEEENCSDPN